MIFNTREQSTAWMEHGLQIPLKRYALSMEDKMAAGTFGRATNYVHLSSLIKTTPTMVPSTTPGMCLLDIERTLLSLCRTWSKRDITQPLERHAYLTSSLVVNVASEINLAIKRRTWQKRRRSLPTTVTQPNFLFSICIPVFIWSL